MLDKVLLQIAKTAILSRFDTNYKINKEELLKKYPYLKQKGASFVTLNKNENLRGCIGSIIAFEPLLDDIIRNALSAAFNDPRFSPLTSDEFNELYLEVSLLSEPVFVKYKDYNDLRTKITPKEDGLILKYKNYQGTFLPQVWDELNEIDIFLEHLSYKAGANPSIYQLHPDIYKYKVEHIKGKWDEILPL
jgi:AmmeMemoRadiSam system protein A